MHVVLAQRSPTNGGIVLMESEIDQLEDLPSLWWGALIALGFGVYGAAAGPEDMMDGFGLIFRFLRWFARCFLRDYPVISSRNSRYLNGTCFLELSLFNKLSIR